MKHLPLFGNLGYFFLTSLSLSFLSPSRRLHQHHSIINPAAALIRWLFTVAHRCCLPLSHPAERSAEAITHRLKHLKRYQGAIVHAFKTARNLHSENFTEARNRDKVCLLLSLMLRESSRQQPKRDRKPEVARQLEKYVHLIPSWERLLDIWIGCSTQIIWSPFLWGFQIKKLRFKTACSLRPDCSNELCLVSHMGLNSLRPLLREEASIHVEAEGFQLTASVQVNQDLLATQDRKAKARISAHTDQWLRAVRQSAGSELRSYWRQCCFND